MIPVADIRLAGREREYVLDVLASTRLSAGGFVARFEQAFAAFVGTQHAVACSSGTAALHLALAAAGIGPGDEVLVPTLTFVATANAVRYCGATPVLLDVDPATWTLDVAAVSRAITPRTKAMIPVHLYGHAADLAPLRTMADWHGLTLIEDAAEAPGTRYGGQQVGSIGEMGCFSFYGNKPFTCGEGGMVTTDHALLAAQVRYLAGQAQDAQGHYYHGALGYNYRLTDLQAAVGLAQIEQARALLAARARVVGWYRCGLASVPGVQVQVSAGDAAPAVWMVAVRLPAGCTPHRVADDLHARGIETRPSFTPLHQLPMYADGQPRPVAEALAARLLVLPTHPYLTEADVRYVCAALAGALGRVAA